MKKKQKVKSVIEQPIKGRIKWIDCAKAAAIIAVLVDHNNGLLYTNQAIAKASYYSVCLFVLLSGITAFNTTTVVQGGGAKNRNLFKLLMQYAVATFILQIWYTRFFDLQTHVSHLLHFSIQSPYYFLLFFIQLKLISPFLVLWCRFCDKQKLKYLWHIASVLFLCWLSSILIRYTFMLQVHGGGKNLLGGTFLLLYYIGILLSCLEGFDFLKKWRMWTLAISISFLIIWCWLYVSNKISFDLMLVDYYGAGKNPPSISLIVLSITVLFVCYSCFSLLEDRVDKISKLTVNILAFIGKHTLYIFMYHLLVRDIIFTFYPAILEANVWLMRFGIFMPMLIAPVLAVWLVKMVKNRFLQIALGDN